MDDEDFTFEYDRISGAPPYTIPAGQIKRFPRYIARHGVKHLIDHILTKRKFKINNQVLRDNLAREIVVDEEVFAQQHVETEAERLQKEIEKLNQPSDLELVLARSRASQKGQEPPKPPTAVGTQPKMAGEPVADEKPKPTIKDEKFDQIDKEKEEGTLPELDLDEKLDEPTPVTPTQSDKTITLPTKEALKEFATTEMGMTWDDKMQESFKKLSVKQLINYLQYPLERLVQK